MDIRRVSDFILAGIALTAVAPVILAAGSAIRITTGSPALYKQKRYGLDGKTFTFYKLRTMLDATDATGNLLPDEERKTPLGKFLRSTAIDELPQLWNILKGDMTFIGPRPRLFYLPLEMRGARLVRPGLTGLAQVNTKRNGPRSYEEVLRDDAYYVQHRSLFLDMKIFFQTVGVVLARRVDLQEPCRKEDFIPGKNVQPTTGG